MLLVLFGRDVAVAVLAAATLGGCTRPARDRSIAAPPSALPGRPTFGIGAAVMGPATFVAVDAQWLPVDELALEVGATPMPGLMGGYAGFRLRAAGAGRLAPWLGGFAAGYCGVGEGARGGGVSCAAAVAGRLGVDWSFDRGTFLVSPEVDVLHPMRGYFNVQRPLTPWGGVTLSWMY